MKFLYLIGIKYKKTDDACVTLTTMWRIFYVVRVVGLWFSDN